MPSASTIILEYVCPLGGCIMGNLMFSAPYRDVKAAVKRGYLGDLNPTPWAFMTGNCFGWVAYSFLKQNLFIFFANAPGFVLSVWLNLSAAKLQYSYHRESEMRQSLTLYLEENNREGQSQLCDVENEDAQETAGPLARTVDFAKVVWDVTSQHTKAPTPHEHLVVAMVLIWLALVTLLSFANFTKSTQENIVGFVVNANLLFFYGAPLSTIFTVLKTRNSASIHIPTMITNTLNGTFWTAYGIAIFDFFIIVPNGIGAGLGAIQIFLVLTFPRIPVEKQGQARIEPCQGDAETELHNGQDNGDKIAVDKALREDSETATDTA